jgi:hypothetical protein
LFIQEKFTESRGSLMRLSACVLAIAVLSPLAARAQTPAEAVPPPPPPPPPPAPMAPPPAVVVVPAPPAAPPAKTWKDLLLVEGLVDTYYLYNFTGSNSMVAPGGRQFDTNPNTFTLNYAKVGLGVTPDPVGLRIDLGYGATGKIINGALGASEGAQGLEAFIVQQAYATVVPVAGLTLDFGKFVTTAGSEVIESNKNWMYSRSILFFNIPLLHTGIRATYQATKELILQASVVNGWNGTGVNPDVTKDKTYGVSINYTAPTGTNIILTGYFGKGELASPDTRVLGDLVVAHTIGNLGLNLNVDYVNDKAGGIDNFIGVAPMVHYVISDHLTFSARAEFAKTASLKLYEGTANIGVPFGGRFEARLELRDDYASVESFDPVPTATIAGGEKNQFTGTVAFLAWF